MNNRRKLLVVLGASVITAPLASFAQQKNKVWRVGFLASTAPPPHVRDAFRESLREHGYVEGKNISIEYRWTDDSTERLAEFAADLVREKVDVIFAWATAAAVAAKQASSTLPIVMVGIADPVGSGLVASFARPGGNVTGTSNLMPVLSSKQVEMLALIVPGKSRFAVLRNTLNLGSPATLKGAEAAARRLGRPLQVVGVRGPDELESAFEDMTKARAAGVVILPDPAFIVHRRRIANLTLKHRLPSVFARRENVEAGGLLSYGASTTGQIRAGATYIDKILKGAKPADLPIEQPREFELVVNYITAKALGIKIPQSILVQATKVIE